MQPNTQKHSFIQGQHWELFTLRNIPTLCQSHIFPSNATSHFPFCVVSQSNFYQRLNQNSIPYIVMPPLLNQNNPSFERTFITNVVIPVLLNQKNPSSKGAASKARPSPTLLCLPFSIRTIHLSMVCLAFQPSQGHPMQKLDTLSVVPRDRVCTSLYHH